ncbi:hypothetical protein BGP_6624 [Beggiatoa sp. PS]|nr:hypothetical protein BGP_6624 [Beggiatoa sp. PS]
MPSLAIPVQTNNSAGGSFFAEFQLPSLAIPVQT